jgi:thiol-disulfide isomerase/thioredoxin
MKKIVIISAVWCHACLTMRKRNKALKDKYPEWTWVEYDLDLDDELVEPLKVGKLIPLYIIFENELEVKRISGEMSLDVLESELTHV